MESLSFRLVRHDLPDGSAHFDVFLLPPGELLPTLELQDSPELRGILGTDTPVDDWAVIPAPAGTGMRAVRKADHRAVYRDYEGPISGGRGSIEEVGRGRWQAGIPEKPGAHVWISLEALDRGR